jgi:membrane fusion protein (multidrug efflux system)
MALAAHPGLAKVNGLGFQSENPDFPARPVAVSGTFRPKANLPQSILMSHFLLTSCNFRRERVGRLKVISIRYFSAAFAAATLLGCKKQQAVTPPPPVVQMMEVKGADVPISTTLIGQLDSPNNVEVRARVEGIVAEMLFIEGTEVKQGDLLFRIDPKPFQERLAATMGALAEAEAALNKYQKDVARLSPLAERRAIPQQDLDNALASVEVGKAGVETAKARVESAQIDLGYCEIKAPADGLIGAKQVSIGELVGKDEPTLMSTISSLDPIWFYCNVSEVEYLQAEERSRKLGRDVASLPLTLIRPDGNEHKVQGKFIFIDRAVNMRTGTLRVRAEFPNPEKLLRPGMFARVRVELGTRKDAIIVPQRAVSQLQGKNFVWRIDENGTASQRLVQVAEQVGSDFLISEGLAAGEKIIVEGVHKAREGAPVTAMTAAQFAARASASAKGKP